jgi:hypothetical protein
LVLLVAVSGVLAFGASAATASANVDVKAGAQCPRGWLCVWIDPDFEGPIARIREGDGVWLRDFYYNPRNFSQVRFQPEGIPGWINFERKVSSVYNNTEYALQAPLHSVFPVGASSNYHAPRGVPIAYVGNLWDNSFNLACACQAK